MESFFSVKILRGEGLANSLSAHTHTPGQAWGGPGPGGASARALAVREASEEIHGAPWLPWIPERVEKVYGGEPPKQAVGQLLCFAIT